MSIKENVSKLHPIKMGGRFFNPVEFKNKKNKFSEYFSLVKSFVHEIAIFIRSFLNWKNRSPQNLESWIQKDGNILPSSKQLNITWIGHATFLIQINNINILTDPIFDDITFLFPRIFDSPIAINQLPKIDYVLISHNHLDHMDSHSLLNLKKTFADIKFLIPKGDKRWFDNRGLSDDAIEFNWWEKFKSNDVLKDIELTFLPAHHWSQRGLFDQNRSLWGSWMIQSNGQSVYFAGDTGYSQHFDIIAKEFSQIDVALMPIGPCEPREKMCHSHISAEEAGKSFIDLNAKHFIPMHWGTYYFGVDHFDTPILRLQQWWKQNDTKLNDKFLNVVKFGQRLEFTLSEKITSPKSSSLEI